MCSTLLVAGPQGNLHHLHLPEVSISMTGSSIAQHAQVCHQCYMCWSLRPP